ncbi:hypothetical protein ABZY81_21965 [Streptomyces sp. NPDC006514]|uniref:hypothetical protein n=1 Tax=Streptomyces sp. NPDC006514 TaxID=3154308 RepID=UPI0033B4BA43
MESTGSGRSRPEPRQPFPAQREHGLPPAPAPAYRLRHSDRHRREAAEILHAAQQHRGPVRPLTERYEGIDAQDAYEIQLPVIRRRCTEGAAVTGLGPVSLTFS